jgi:signal transduction histidine kinase/DNA-binding LacI/PurR family transcriptional regulator
MEIRYKSEAAAVIGRKASRPTIGVFRSNNVGLNHSVQWQGLIDAAKKKDVNLICYSGGQLNSWHGDESEAAVIYKLISTQRLAGIVIWTGNLNWNTPHDQVQRFVKSYDPLPVVSVEVEIEGIPSLIWDNFYGMSEAVTHLIEVHQCKRIAFIRGNHLQLAMDQRFRAYMHTLEKHEIAFDPGLVWPLGLLFNGEEPLQQLITNITSTNINGIAVCNDHAARRLINVMQAKGLPLVPIVAFDDELESKSTIPALTTIRAPFYEIGYRAIEVLVDLIEGRSVNHLECLPCSLVVRRSCGCSYDAIIKADTWESAPWRCDAVSDRSADINPGEFEKIVAGSVKLSPHIDSQWASKLFNTFLAEARGDEKQLFTSCLLELMEQTTSADGEFNSWRDILFALYFYTDPLIKRYGYDSAKARKMLRQGISVVSELSTRSQTRLRVWESSKLFDVITFIQTLSEVFDLKGLLDKITCGLARLGISRFYLSLYESSDTSLDTARLILAYDPAGLIAIEPEKAIFPSSQLLPDGMLPSDQRLDYILKPLFFQKRQIGFVLFDAGIYDLSIYELLSNALSVSLNGVMMLAELANQASELSQANANLANAYQSLQENQQKLLFSEKMASLGRLTAGIAHEMNTPLAAIRTSLKELNELVDEYRKSIGNPQVLPEDHQAIAADMLKLLKIAGQSAEKNAIFIRGIKAQTIDTKFSNLQVFNAAFVISEALNVLEYAIKKNQCRLVTGLDQSIKLHGDPRRFVQVITNLVMNSIEACPATGGVISVRLESSDGEFARLTVEDNGCGIPKEIIAKIFDPMFTTKPFGEGTGLGLSIVHELVNEYQGSIKVNSWTGFTSFIITLPLIKEELMNDQANPATSGKWETNPISR